MGVNAFAEGRSAAVIGGGPAGLMAADVLSSAGVAVTVYDHMPSVGRKFLMAGRGGLNLTHSEDLDTFLGRYGPAAPHVRDAVERFSPERLREWCAALGQPTFVGSSGRVFPRTMKASPLLRAWLRDLSARNVRLLLRHRWKGWTRDGAIQFETPAGDVAARPDVSILAVGGASWPRLGSDGAWADAVMRTGATVAPFRPSNAGFTVAWSPLFRDGFEGQPLKNVALRFRGRVARGDVIITRNGIEGGAVYGLSADLRDAVERDGPVVVEIGLRPDLGNADLARRLAGRPPKQSLSTALRKALHLSPASIALLHESRLAATEPLRDLAPEQLAALVNAVPVRLNGVAPLERAISTSGGLVFSDLDPQYMIRKRPGTFAAGEMLDWEAPTGGYLLQACFATGAMAGQGALAWLDRAR